MNTATNSKSGKFEGDTPLISASFNGMTSVVKQLVNNGAIVNAIRKNKQNAAFNAAQEGHLEILKILVSKDPSVADRIGYQGRTPLGAAAMCGHLEVIKFLVEECNSTIDARDEFNHTPLSLATYLNQREAVKYLISQGANVSIKAYQGKTALEWA